MGLIYAALVLVAVIGGIVLGVAGFSAKGIPLTAERRITGRWGQVLGAVAFAFALAALAALILFLRLLFAGD